MSTLPKLIGILFLSVILFIVFVYLSVPHLSALRFVNPGRTALMVARGGDVRQTWVPLPHISIHLRRAIIAAEDANFYGHNGIDIHEMRESIKKNLRKRKFARGFSTITMQLAKNLYLSPQKTITRKLLEILIAWKMER
jgi:monofunctional biosynthetic peptidoglycan transglycosylase